MTTAETNHALESAKGAAVSILEMVTEEDWDSISEDPLEIVTGIGRDLREPMEWEEADTFMILLSTGGPASRIIGDLDEHKLPSRPRIEYQDWGTPWRMYSDMSWQEQEALQTYVEQFYYGE